MLCCCETLHQKNIKKNFHQQWAKESNTFLQQETLECLQLNTKWVSDIWNQIIFYFIFSCDFLMPCYLLLRFLFIRKAFLVLNFYRMYGVKKEKDALCHVWNSKWLLCCDLNIKLLKQIKNYCANKSLKYHFMMASPFFPGVLWLSLSSPSSSHIIYIELITTNEIVLAVSFYAIEDGRGEPEAVASFYLGSFFVLKK